MNVNKIEFSMSLQFPRCQNSKNNKLMYTNHVLCMPAPCELHDAIKMSLYDIMAVNTPSAQASSPENHPNNPTTVKKSRWTSEEDEKLVAAVKVHGARNWAKISDIVGTRNGKQCRERWIIHHDPSFSRDSWTADEDAELLRLWSELGNKWSKIAKLMKGRSTTNIKNRFKFLNNHKLIDQPQSPSNSLQLEELDSIGDECFDPFACNGFLHEELLVPFI